MAIETSLLILIILGIIILIALAIFLFVFWILMIIDCVKRNFKNETEKIVWILVLVFLQILGAIIYYFAIKRANPKLGLFDPRLGLGYKKKNS